MNVLFFSQNILNIRRQENGWSFRLLSKKIPKKLFCLGCRERFKVCDSFQTANNKGNWLTFYRLLVLLFFFLPLLGLITQNLWNYWKPFLLFVFLVLRECQKCKKSQLVSSSLDVSFHCSPKMKGSFFICFSSKNFLLVGLYNTSSRFFDHRAWIMIIQLLLLLVTSGADIWKNRILFNRFQFKDQRSSNDAYLWTETETIEKNKALTSLDCFDLEVFLFYAGPLTNVV